MEWQPAAGGFVQAVAALMYLAVAAILLRRPVSEHARMANTAFAVWWASLALYNGTLAVMAWLAPGSTRVALVMRILQVLLLSVAGAGLTTYVLYLFSGRRWVFRAASGYYLFMAAWFLLFTIRHRPVGFETTGMLTEARYAVPIGTGEYQLLLVLFGLPLLVGSALYLRLYWKVPDARSRYRIAMVGISLVVWIGSGLAARLTDGNGLNYATLVGMGILSAAAALLAYAPPAPVARRLEQEGSG